MTNFFPNFKIIKNKLLKLVIKFKKKLLNHFLPKFMIVVRINIIHIGIFILEKPIGHHIFNGTIEFFISSAISTTSNILTSPTIFGYKITSCDNNLEFFHFMFIVFNITCCSARIMTIDTSPCI